MNDLDPVDFRHVNIGGLHPAPKRVSVWRDLWWDLLFPVGTAMVLVVGLVWWLVQ